MIGNDLAAGDRFFVVISADHYFQQVAYLFKPRD
jgi:hypothetical protein